MRIPEQRLGKKRKKDEPPKKRKQVDTRNLYELMSKFGFISRRTDGEVRRRLDQTERSKKKVKARK